LANGGSAQIDDLLVTSTAGLPLATSVTLTYSPNALGAGVPGFNVAGIAGGPLAYDPATQSQGATFSIGGFDFSVNGTPAPGDELSIGNNIGGSGDNRNVLALAGLQTAQQLTGGTASYQETYSRLVAAIAVQTRQAETGAATEAVLLDQAVGARESVSGVNLDEEAADLIRFQQAYQAAAQMISIADQLFQTLLNATRR
jgi:flagellar hook-associated protein 1 FlgK